LSTRKAVDAAVEQAMLLQKLRPRSTASVHDPRASSDNSAPTWIMKSLPADALADSLCDRGEVQIEIHVEISSLTWLQFSERLSGATSARMAQAIECRPVAWGSAGSRPDSHARQNICARTNDLAEEQRPASSVNSRRARSAARTTP